jgi:hypothetical protein
MLGAVSSTQLVTMIVDFFCVFVFCLVVQIVSNFLCFAIHRNFLGFCFCFFN